MSTASSTNTGVASYVVDEAGAVDLPRARRRHAGDLDDGATDLADDRAALQRRIGCRHVTDLGGRERVEHVGQAAPVDGLAQVVVDRPHPGRDRVVDGLDERGLPHLPRHLGERRGGQRRGDHPGDQQHRGGRDDRAGDRVEHLGRFPGDLAAHGPADRPGEDLPEQRAGQHDHERGEDPRDAGAVDPLGDRTGQLRPDHRTAEEAGDGGGRHEQALPEPRQREGEGQHDQDDVHE
jgi:hypothetical protein